jgi:exodeoxyribonuclease VII large subunit
VTAALQELDTDPAVDVIVVARGGGSLEDLLPFSDESFIRAAAGASTPLVSAIGHEPDWPILDLVADFRAATPTEAGKRIVPDWADEKTLLDDAVLGLRRTISARMERDLEGLAVFRSRPALADPTWIIANRTAEVATLLNDARRAIVLKLNAAEASLQTLGGRLAALSPQSTLERGYALVTKAGALVTDPATVAGGDRLRVRVAGGVFAAEALGSEP